jgi:hypothetical protein
MFIQTARLQSRQVRSTMGSPGGGRGVDTTNGRGPTEARRRGRRCGLSGFKHAKGGLLRIVFG